MGSAWLMLYHDVQSDPDTLWAVSPEQLAEAVNNAREQGLAVTSIDTALAAPEDAVSLTFDDAYRSVYETAFPLLSSLGVTGTVFVPVDWVGRTSTRDATAPVDGGECPIMDWNELADLAAHGWTIGSHGCAHVALHRLTRAQVEEEVRRSKHVIEDRLGREVVTFAYPYGVVPPWQSGPTMDDMLASAGYQFGVLAFGGPVPKPPRSPYRLGREPVAPGQRVTFTMAT